MHTYIVEVVGSDTFRFELEVKADNLGGAVAKAVDECQPMTIELLVMVYCWKK